MALRTSVVWDDVFTAYDFGPDHPMGPVRLDLTTRLARALGVLDHVDVISPGVADDHLLATVHDPAYVAAVKAASADPARADARRGLGTEDDPAFAGMHEALGPHRPGHRRRLPAGVGAARPSTASTTAAACTTRCAPTPRGFCIYNDIAVGIQWLLDHGAEQVAYVDIDVHHGDGVERIFWNDPRVLTVSVHESGQHLFPGTGWPGDVGGPRRARQRRQRRPAARDDRRVLAAGHRRGRAAARAGLRARRARHPARLRHPPRGPARPPGDHGRRPAPGPRRAPPPRPRGVRRPLGRPRRGRLRARRRRAALLDPPRRRSPRTTPST